MSPPRERVALAFSGGKDSSLALRALRTGDRFKVSELITTLTEGYDRISMHGVRRSLLREQAVSIGPSPGGLRLRPSRLGLDAVGE